MLFFKFVSISPCLLSRIDADIFNLGDVKMLWAPALGFVGIRAPLAC